MGVRGHVHGRRQRALLKKVLRDPIVQLIMRADRVEPAQVRRGAAASIGPGRVGPPIGRPPASIRQYFIVWLDKDGHPFWQNIRSWWQIRDLPNLVLLHFGQLKADLPGQIRRIAAFLDIEVDKRRWPAIVEHCGFDYMKTHATKSVPLGGAFWDGGAQTFVYQGTNGRWRDVLSAADCRRYEETARRELGEARPLARHRRAAPPGCRMSATTFWRDAQFDTIRLSLIKVGARAQLKVPPHVVEKITNHSSAGVAGPMGKIYQRYDYLEERRAALELWAETLLRIVRTGSRGEVVELRAG
jgi:hypothetical protein